MDFLARLAVDRRMEILVPVVATVGEQDRAEMRAGIFASPEARRIAVDAILGQRLRDGHRVLPFPGELDAGGIE